MKPTRKVTISNRCCNNLDLLLTLSQDAHLTALDLKTLMVILLLTMLMVTFTNGPSQVSMTILEQLWQFLELLVIS